MYQGDPTINGTRSDHDQMKLDQLGAEAKAILKSIQTEDTKLQQSGQLMRSDLHYFRARFNYYRLSLMRLLPEERKALEPILSNFRCHIVENEAGVGDSKSETSYTPFLAPVEKASASASKAAEPAAVSSMGQISEEMPRREIKNLEKTQAYGSSMAPVQTSVRATDMSSDVLNDLRLVRLALTGQISPESAPVVIQALDHVIAKIEKRGQGG